MLAEIQHEIILFCLGNATEQSTEIDECRKRIRPDHGLEESNSIIFLDIDESVPQSLSETDFHIGNTREVSFPAREEGREVTEQVGSKRTCIREMKLNESRSILIKCGRLSAEQHHRTQRVRRNAAKSLCRYATSVNNVFGD